MGPGDTQAKPRRSVCAAPGAAVTQQVGTRIKASIGSWRSQGVFPSARISHCIEVESALSTHRQ